MILCKSKVCSKLSTVVYKVVYLFKVVYWRFTTSAVPNFVCNHFQGEVNITLERLQIATWTKNSRASSGRHGFVQEPRK